MQKVKLDIFITTLLFLLFFGIMKRILLNQTALSPVWHQALFFFVTYGLWKILTSSNDGNPYYCL
jgi:hypothetical protein